MPQEPGEAGGHPLPWGRSAHRLGCPSGGRPFRQPQPHGDLEPPPEIRERETGVYDAYGERKAVEFRRACGGSGAVEGFFPIPFEGALRSSAFGNGGDFFVDHAYNPDLFFFGGDVAKIEHQVYISEKILILGDNPGDFLFDLPLVNRFEKKGEKRSSTRSRSTRCKMTCPWPMWRGSGREDGRAPHLHGHRRGRHKTGRYGGKDKGMLGGRQSW